MDDFTSKRKIKKRSGNNRILQWKTLHWCSQKIREWRNHHHHRNKSLGLLWFFQNFIKLNQLLLNSFEELDSVFSFVLSSFKENCCRNLHQSDFDQNEKKWFLRIEDTSCFGPSHHCEFHENQINFFLIK